MLQVNFILEMFSYRNFEYLKDLSSEIFSSVLQGDFIKVYANEQRKITCGELFKTMNYYFLSICSF